MQTPFDPSWDDWMQAESKIGFANNGSECYRNVTFQMLLHSPVFIHWVAWYRKHHIPEGQPCKLGSFKQTCKVCLMHDLCVSYWDNNAGNYEECFQTMWERVFSDWADGNNKGQQDTTEFWPELYRQLYEDTRDLL